MDRGFAKPKSTQPVRGLLRGLAVLCFSLGLITGCNRTTEFQPAADHTRSDAQKTNPTWFSACPGCRVITKPVTLVKHLVSISDDHSLRMSFALVVDEAIATPDVSKYYGRAALLGRWRVADGSEYVCTAPAGDYIVRPLTPSYMTSGAISGGTYEAVGPSRIVFRLVNALTVGNRLSLKVTVDTVDNNSCGRSLFTHAANATSPSNR